LWHVPQSRLLLFVMIFRSFRVEPFKSYNLLKVIFDVKLKKK